LNNIKQANNNKQNKTNGQIPAVAGSQTFHSVPTLQFCCFDSREEDIWDILQVILFFSGFPLVQFF